MPTRLAWFTPLPPTRSGIAAYSAELLPALADTHRIDVFVDAPAGVRAPGATEVHDAHDFVWRHARRPYDLIVYQLGNSPCHDYLWPYLVRYPGLAVLHDGQLHHARARALIAAGRAGDYRAEFAYNHPRVPRSVADLGAAGLLGALNYLWPMRRLVLDASRAALAHNAWLADDLRRESPALHVEVVEMGVPDPAAGPGARERARARLGVPPDAVLLAAFGKVTPEKRIAETLRALAALDGGLPPWRLMLCGEPVDHYDAREDARKLGLGGRVSVTGYVGEAEMPACIAAADVCLCLRWPSSRETSASWLRCLAAGKPTIVTDLVHLGDVPALDPRDWRIANPPSGRDARGRPVRPVCVAIDVVDERRALACAVARLAADAALRAALGAASRRLWRRRFTLDRMAAGYRRAIEAARRKPPGPARREALLPHLRRDGTERLRALIEEAGMPAAHAPDL